MSQMSLWNQLNDQTKYLRKQTQTEDPKRICQGHPLTPRSPGTQKTTDRAKKAVGINYKNSLKKQTVLLNKLRFLSTFFKANFRLQITSKKLTHNGGKDENSSQEIGHHKQILHIVLRRRSLSNGGQRQRGPVEAIDVLPLEGVVPRSIQIIDPRVRAEADLVADGKVHAGIPVDQHQDGQDDLADAESIGISGGRLRSVKPLPQPVYPKQAVQAHDDGTGQVQAGAGLRWPPDVGQVRGQHRQHVQIPALRVEVVPAQPERVPHEEPLVQESCQG